MVVFYEHLNHAFLSHMIMVMRANHVILVVLLTLIAASVVFFNLTAVHQTFSTATFRYTPVVADTQNGGKYKIQILQIEANQGKVISILLFEPITPALTHQRKSICEYRDFEEIVRPCYGNTKWTERTPNNKSKTTSVQKSIVELIVRPRPYASTVKIKTRNMLDELKHSGGDYWDVKIVEINSIEKLMINIQMRDLSNGAYIGHFVLPVDRGDEDRIYQLNCVLEYTDCNGIRDPPPNWFIKGTVQGKFQRDGLIGDCDDFLHKLYETKVHFKSITPITSNHNHNDISYDRLTNDITESSSVKPFNRFCGFWQNGKFREHTITRDNEKGTTLSRKREFIIRDNYAQQRPFETLIIFGDSMARHFHESIHQNHTLCSKWFKRCLLSNIWVYKFKNETRDRYEGVHVYDGKDFNQTKFVEAIQNDLLSLLGDTNTAARSVYVFNFGCHTIMTLPMQQLQQLLQAVMVLIDTLRIKYTCGSDGDEKFPLVIWKSTTPPTLENFIPSPSTQLRFLTKQRIYAWNAYSLSVISRYKIPILDVYTMATSYPDGPYDIVHYENSVFKSAEDDLEDFIIKTFNKS